MPLIDTLRSIVGAPHCLAADIDMAPYLTDWRGRYTGRARAVVLPADTAQVAAVMRACAGAGCPVVREGAAA